MYGKMPKFHIQIPLTYEEERGGGTDSKKKIVFQDVCFINHLKHFSYLLKSNSEDLM